VEDRGEGGVLVHCMMGISRSSSVCIAWLMSRKAMSYDDAYKLMKAKRPIVCPNSGFAAQLKMWEKQGCDMEKWRAWRLMYGPGEPLTVKLS
jgi:protein-tyrosine phosphatase